MSRKSTIKKTVKKKEVEAKPKKTKKIGRIIALKKSKKEIAPKIKGILAARKEEISKVTTRTKTNRVLIKKPAIRKNVTKEMKVTGQSLVVGALRSRGPQDRGTPFKVRKVPSGNLNYSELPSGYNDTKITALVRDPYWIYAYWEISNEKIEEVKRTIWDIWNCSKTILRVYDVTDIIFNGSNAHSFFDITLGNLSNYWYINTGAPDRSYCVDIGVLTPDNKFYLFARSNVVKTPRNTISNILDEEWLLSEEEVSKIYIPDKIDVGGSLEVGKWIRIGLKEQVLSSRINQ